MSGTRPAVVVLVAGTGTEVGKTWVAARLLTAWRAGGRRVAARKPVQSFTPGGGATDAEVLGAAAGEDPAAVCPPERSYPVALAPPMAAEALGLAPPTLAGLVAGLDWPRTPVDVGLVESAGGVRSPQADDGDVVDLVHALAPDRVVVVADAGLGTVNAVRLTVAALTGTALTGAALTGAALTGAAPTGARRPGRRPVEVEVVLNRFEATSDLHRRNLAWLRGRDGTCAVPATDGELAALARRLALPLDA